MIDIMIQANPLMWSSFYVYKIYANRLKEILLASDRKWSMFLPWGFVECAKFAGHSTLT